MKKKKTHSRLLQRAQRVIAPDVNVHDDLAPIAARACDAAEVLVIVYRIRVRRGAPRSGSVHCCTIVHQAKARWRFSASGRANIKEHPPAPVVLIVAAGRVRDLAERAYRGGPLSTCCYLKVRGHCIEGTPAPPTCAAAAAGAPRARQVDTTSEPWTEGGVG